MVANKDLKRLVRGRMSKTGESYTAARAQLLRKRITAAPRPAPAPANVLVAPPDYAQLAGMSDAAISKKTGCSWDKWVYVLDKAKAYEWDHPRIAEYVHTKYKVGPWWGQMVTVGYERIKGLREKGQRRSGQYEASKSKTMAVPVARLFKAFSVASQRSKWLPGMAVVVRTSTPDRSLRMTWPDDTSVECWFVAKGTAKSTVQLSHTKLGSREDVARMKEYWGERLEALAGMLTG